MILDSNFLIYLVSGEIEAFEKSEELHGKNEDLRVASPSIFEVYYGAIYEDADEDEIRRIENLLWMYYFESVDEEIEKRGAELVAEADENAGGVGESGVDNEDARIAAIAEDIDEKVFTENAKDFEKLGVDYDEY